LAPYEVFAAIHSFGPQFNHFFLGHDGAVGVGDYWTQYGMSMDHHIPREHASAQGSYIPLYVHSDGGEVYNNEEYSIWSWSSALVQGCNTWDYKFFMCMVPERRKFLEVTESEIVDFLVWNIQVLESKKFPSHDHLQRLLTGNRAHLAGQALAGDWGAAFVAHLGDLKERVKLHRLSRNYQCNFMCEKCVAHRYNAFANGYDFGPNAVWRQLEVSHETYLLSTPEHSRSPFCRLRSWTIHRNRPDLLHGVWLGIAKDVCGQFMFDIVTMYMSDDMSANLVMIHRQMLEWYREQGMHCGVPVFRQTTLSWKDQDDIPVLEAKMKGAHSKLVFLYLSWLSVMIVNSGVDTSPYAVLRATMLCSLSDVIKVFDHSGRFMTQAEADRVLLHGNLFLVSYQRLAAEALMNHQFAYKLRPKMHDFAHLLIEVGRTRENPRQRDLFDAEDYIGKIKGLAAACHKRRVDLSVCHRLILFLTHRWDRRRHA
jgi:hypothetical protein